MKEKKSDNIIPVSELVENGIYFSNNNELIKIKKIDNKNKELYLYNITEHYNILFVKFENHNLTKRIR